MFAKETLSILRAVEFDVAFQMLAHHILDLFGRDLLPVETGEDPRVSDGAAPDHDRVTASVLLHTLDIGDGFHIPAADDRDPGRSLDLCHGVPAGVATVALLFGT